MAKTKYHYNSKTLKYEKIKSNPWNKVLKIGGFISTSFILASVILYASYSYIDSPNEKQLKRELDQMSLQYEILQERMDQVSIVLDDIQERDDDIYRTIFNADPIHSDIRQAGFGGVNRYRNLENYRNSEIMIESAKKIDEIAKTLTIQSKSYEELMDLAKSKSEMMASIPAISPINSKNLHKGISGFGSRVHPVYKIKKNHMGIDFASPTGTPIYATGDGKVVQSGRERGYGNMVKIDHGHGYETLYGHMSKIKVRKGQKIKRGEVIGHVGNTGISTGPHLHYEVIKNKKPVNPINFFYNDLTPSEYLAMTEAASQVNQSFD
ncbi:MAG TPA: M23 family metallopeptidase [Sphingobacteriaceae bacterium]|nr:M23 family metallopeptidase [Sphingobacteriaceae bacterium]